MYPRSPRQRTEVNWSCVAALIAAVVLDVAIAWAIYRIIVWSGLFA